jgi:hypothetical protein
MSGFSLMRGGTGAVEDGRMSPFAHLIRAGLLVCICLVVVPQAAASARPAVVPPDATVQGRTYGEWSALWWQQVLAIPAATNPLAQQGRVECELGRGKVRFLVGTLGGDAQRSCSVPAGVTLLVPMINGECSTAEGNGTTAAELRACAEGLIEPVSSLNASVDGRPIRRLRRFRFTSPLFAFDLPAGDVLGKGPVASPSVAAGFWVMLRPLPRGRHVVRFGGAIETLDFSVQVTYRLRVR